MWSAHKKLELLQSRVSTQEYLLNYRSGKKRKQESEISVVVTMENNAPLYLTFEIENDNVKLISPEKCKFGFSFDANSYSAESHGYACEGYGKRVLPRLFLGAVTAFQYKFPHIETIRFSGEALVNFDPTFNMEEYKKADDADTNLENQAKKVAWRLIYYKKLGFDVDGDANDMRDFIKESIEEDKQNSEDEESDEKDESDEEEYESDEEGYEDESDEENKESLSIPDTYISYGGELVSLCQNWKNEFKISAQIVE